MPIPSSRSGLGNALASVRRYAPRLFELGPPVPWNRNTYLALLTLVLLWAVRMYATWATWGSLTIDGGHEMYVPALLSQGKTLYRDVWWQYTPLSAYLNSYLFRIFGENLNVLYWAGSLSALGSALLLYLTGMRLSSWIAGWSAAAVLLIQAFQPWIFCFPLPYSFAAVYGCLTACLFLWFTVLAATSDGWVWVFGAGTAAALATLNKLEFGAACYVTLLLLIAARWFQSSSWRGVARDLLAIFPGVAVCALVARWMISIGGIAFITQENMLSWPTSYYMKTYGKQWLASTGLALNRVAFTQATLRTVLVVAVYVGFCRILRRAQSDERSVFLGAALVVASLASIISLLAPRAEVVFRWIFFPQDMVLYIAIAAVTAWCFFGGQPVFKRTPAIALLLTFSGLLAVRILLGMKPSGYPIYYNGPAILAFLLLVPSVFSRPARSSLSVFPGELLVCFVCLAAVVLHTSLLPTPWASVPLTTSHGMIRTSESLARSYQAAIAFMKEKASLGETVLSIPEDTSLYFLSDTRCPTRVFMFVPGILVPGKMTDEFISDLERKHVRYLLWSNRTFPEMNAPNFGTDFDRPVGEYLRSHYRFVRPLDPDAWGWEWNAGIYERKPESQ
jgi:hypothetical protein